MARCRSDRGSTYSYDGFAAAHAGHVAHGPGLQRRVQLHEQPHYADRTADGRGHLDPHPAGELHVLPSGTHAADVGTDGDSVQVQTSALKSGGNVETAADWTVCVEQYRYGTGGQLKSVFDTDAIAARGRPHGY